MKSQLQLFCLISTDQFAMKIFVVSFLVIFLSQDSTQDLFQSLDFAREALMSFSKEETQVVQVKSPEEKKVILEEEKATIQPFLLRPLKKTKKHDGGGGIGKKASVIASAYAFEGGITLNHDKSFSETFTHGAGIVYNYTSLLKPKPKYIAGNPNHRPKPTKPKITKKHKTKVYRPRSSPSNRFLMALNKIERAVAEAKVAGRRQRFSHAQLNKLKSYIILGARQRSYQFAWRAVGQALHLLELKGTNRRRGKRSSENAATGFLSDLKNQMGNDKFNTFLAVQGDATLMFAIDTTGSMSEEIESAKKIAIDVVNHKRKNSVDYILSPFNDPGKTYLSFMKI